MSTDRGKKVLGSKVLGSRFSQAAWLRSGQFDQTKNDSVSAENSKSHI
jgi:K+-transporting ATPase c subunit